MGEAASWAMESMWRDLPPGILDNVFTFLPIACVCRWRVLSKEWNRFLTSPAFATRHTMRAPPADDHYALLTLRWMRLDGHGWDVLDVANQRYITFSDAFLAKYVQPEGIAFVLEDEFYGAFLAAADGGIFCVRYYFNGETSALFVCNPVVKSVKQLPLPHIAEWEDFSQTVVMATNRASMEYEIVIVHAATYYTEGVPCEPDSILIYESKTGRWRTAPYKGIVPLVTYPVIRYGGAL